MAGNAGNGIAGRYEQAGAGAGAGAVAKDKQGSSVCHCKLSNCSSVWPLPTAMTAAFFLKTYGCQICTLAHGSLPDTPLLERAHLLFQVFWQNDPLRNLS